MNVFNILTLFMTFKSTFGTLTNFDHLGLDKFTLTPEEELLSLKAQEISAKNLLHLDILPPDNLQNHHRVKRGNSENPGYYALPLPPLPSNIDETKVRLFTRPNQKLIGLVLP